MAVDTTTILEEVAAITSAPHKAMMSKVMAMIKAGETWVSPIRLDNLTRRRDYVRGYGDAIYLDVLLPQGDLAYVVEPNKDDLFVDVFVEKKYAMNQGETDEDITVKRYRAILLTRQDTGITSPSPHASSRADMNQSIAEAQFQLIEENAHQLSMVSVGRTYRKLNPMSALKAIFTDASAKIEVEENDRVVGVDVTPGFNTTPREVIPIPHGTLLTQVPDFLQNQEGGLYSTGVGCYLQHNCWYVYPLYALNRWEDERRTLTIVRVPPNRLTASEVTYRVTDDQVLLVANHGIRAMDRGKDAELAHGNSVRVTNADTLLTFGETKENRTSFKRKENLYEFRAEGVKEGAELHNARWADTRATTNPFPLYSRLAEQNTQLLEIDWLQGNIDLLYPGMPVQFLVANDDELLIHQGTLLGANDRYTPMNAGPVSEVYNNESKLLIAVNRV